LSLYFTFQRYSWFMWTRYWLVMYTEETSSTVTHIYIQPKHTSGSPLSPTLRHLIHSQSRNGTILVDFSYYFLSPWTITPVRRSILCDIRAKETVLAAAPINILQFWSCSFSISCTTVSSVNMSKRGLTSHLQCLDSRVIIMAPFFIYIYLSSNVTPDSLITK
jgi:hypothetical protein